MHCDALRAIHPTAGSCQREVSMDVYLKQICIRFASHVKSKNNETSRMD
jgi:hypothetical protein